MPRKLQISFVTHGFLATHYDPDFIRRLAVELKKLEPNLIVKLYEITVGGDDAGTREVETLK